MDDSDSDLSSALSSPPPEEELLPPPKNVLKLVNGKLTRAPTEATPVAPPSPSPEPQREPSPPHEYVLADNPDIAFIVAFRTKFTDAFPKNVPNLGPQDIERGVVDPIPSEQVEHLLCALLGLVLNRKKYVERGHYGRALEEAISTQKPQWPRSWKDASPISGGKTFQSMIPTERITLLKTLVLWSLNASEHIQNILKEAYKQSRHDDDLNQPLAVHPRGADGLKRRYWMIEGDNDTPFRIYRESNPKRKENTWWSVAESIVELQSLSITLKEDKSQAARRLADHLISEVPRLEEVEEKRKRKEYRQARKAAFSRPEPGYSLYEGRTRGKRMKYTYSDDEDDLTDGPRRSSRNANKDILNAEETVTASGRHVRSRFGRSYGDAIDSNRESSEFGSDVDRDRAQRAARRAGGPRRPSYEMSEGSDNGGADVSGDDWDGTGDAEDEDEDEVMSEAGSDDSLMDGSPRSLVVKLKVKPYDDRRSRANSPDPLAKGMGLTPQKPLHPDTLIAPHAVPTPGSDAEKSGTSEVKPILKPSAIPAVGSFGAHWSYKPQPEQQNGESSGSPLAAVPRDSPPRTVPPQMPASPVSENYTAVKLPPEPNQPLTPNTDVSPDGPKHAEYTTKPLPAMDSSPREPSPLKNGLNEYEHRPVVLSPKPPTASIDKAPSTQSDIRPPQPVFSQAPSSDRF